MRRGALEPVTAAVLFSDSLGLKTCHHSLEFDSSHMEFSWPIRVGACTSVVTAITVGHSSAWFPLMGVIAFLLNC